MKFTDHFQSVFADTTATAANGTTTGAQASTVDSLLASEDLTNLLREEPGLSLLQRIAEITEGAFIESGEEAPTKATEYLLETLEEQLVKDVLSTSAALLEHTLEVIKLLYPELSADNADETVSPEHSSVFFAADLTANLLRDCARSPIRINMLLLDDTATRLQKELQTVLENLALSMGLDPEMLAHEAAERAAAGNDEDEDEDA